MAAKRKGKCFLALPAPPSLPQDPPPGVGSASQPRGQRAEVSPCCSDHTINALAPWMPGAWAAVGTGLSQPGPGLPHGHGSGMGMTDPGQPQPRSPRDPVTLTRAGRTCTPTDASCTHPAHGPMQVGRGQGFHALSRFKFSAVARYPDEGRWASPSRPLACPGPRLGASRAGRARKGGCAKWVFPSSEPRGPGRRAEWGANKDLPLQPPSHPQDSSSQHTGGPPAFPPPPRPCQGMSASRAWCCGKPPKPFLRGPRCWRGVGGLDWSQGPQRMLGGCPTIPFTPANQPVPSVPWARQLFPYPSRGRARCRCTGPGPLGSASPGPAGSWLRLQGRGPQGCSPPGPGVRGAGVWGARRDLPPAPETRAGGAEEPEPGSGTRRSQHRAAGQV